MIAQDISFFAKYSSILVVSISHRDCGQYPMLFVEKMITKSNTNQ